MSDTRALRKLCIQSPLICMLVVLVLPIVAKVLLTLWQFFLFFLADFLPGHIFVLHRFVEGTVMMTDDEIRSQD